MVNDWSEFGLKLGSSRQVDSTVKVGELSPHLFPNGHQYFGVSTLDSLTYLRCTQNLGNVVVWTDRVVVVHNNWIIGKGNKVQRFKDAGLWKVNASIQDFFGHSKDALTSLASNSDLRTDHFDVQTSQCFETLKHVHTVVTAVKCLLSSNLNNVDD